VGTAYYNIDVFAPQALALSTAAAQPLRACSLGWPLEAISIDSRQLSGCKRSRWSLKK
jgi:hypothetical protein